MNITDGIWRNCHAWPERIALIQDGHSFSYAQLMQGWRAAGARLAAAGVARADCVTVAGASPVAYLLLVLALARMGATATAVSMSMPPATRDELIRRHSTRWLVHDSKAAWRSQVLPGHAHLDIHQMLRMPAPAERLPEAPAARDADDDAWLIPLSSGTTGAPKSIPQTHGRSALGFALGRPSYVTEQRVLVVADVSTQMGLGNVLRPLLLGSTVILTSDATPARLLELIAQHRVTRLATTTARAGSLMSHVMAQVPDSREICRSLEVVAISGATAPPALKSAITTRLCPHIEINYGATESGPLATATPQTLAVHPDSAGRIHHWVEAQAVDEQDRALPAGQAGILRFKSATIVQGYLGDPEATARAFRGGWYYPGDMGAVTESGFLMLGGRVDHVLNLGGRKLDPTLVERVLDTHPAVVESVVTAFTGEGGLGAHLVAVVVCRSCVDSQALRDFCREQIEAPLVPRHVVFVDALPKNAGGKVLRAEVAARLQSKPGAKVET